MNIDEVDEGAAMLGQTSVREILGNGWILLIYLLAFGRIIYCAIAGYPMEPGEMWTLVVVMGIAAGKYFAPWLPKFRGQC